MAVTHFNSSLPLLSVITPDGRIVMRSLLYGGKAAEVLDIINKSELYQRLQGILFFFQFDLSLSHFFFLQLMDSWVVLKGMLRSKLLCMMGLGPG